MPNFPTSLPNDGSMLKAQDYVADQLRTSCTNADTTININDGTKFPDPAGATYYATIDSATSATREIISYTGRTTGGSSTLTGVARHLFSTNNVGHNSGVTIEQTIVAAFHEALKTEIVAVATKVGIDSSAVAATHDFKLSEVLTGGSDKAVGKTATQTLTNKTLTSPIINSPTLGSAITLSSATTNIIPGTTTVKFQNNLNNATNLQIDDGGAITVRSTISGVTTLTATTLAGTLSTAAQANVTSLGTLTALGINGNLTFSGASRRVIAGTTDWALTANDGVTNNILVTDAGAITVRSTISGVTTLTVTTVTATNLGGTLTTAAQANVTSLGTLTGLTVGGAVTISTGAITINTSGSMTINRQYFAAKKAVTFSATPTFDWNDSNVQSMTLTGNITTLTLSNPNSGARYMLILTQDATGSRTVAWPAAVKWSSGVAPTLSGANKVDIIGLVYDGTNYYSVVSSNF